MRRLLEDDDSNSNTLAADALSVAATLEGTPMKEAQVLCTHVIHLYVVLKQH